MRIKILQHHTVGHFKRMFELQDEEIKDNIVNTLYSLSCSKENIGRLVNQGILKFCDRIMDDYGLYSMEDSHGGGGFQC